MASTCRKSATSTSANDGGKRKRSHRPLTLNAKLEMIGLSEQGLTRAEISRKLGVPRPTVSTVVNAKEKVLKEVSSATPLNTTLIRKRDSLIADMEKLLLVWIKDQTSHSIPLTQAIIQDKALSLFNSMKAERGKAAVENKFRASRGWFTRFKKRSSLHNTRVQEEVLCSGNLTVAPETYSQEFYQIIEDCGYINQQIFNVTEGAKYANKAPSMTYIVKENTVANMKAIKNRHNLEHGDNFEDFENPDEKDTRDIAEKVEGFEVKVEPDDEAEMGSNDMTMTDSEDDLPVQQRRMSLGVEFHPNDNPALHREIATKELEEAISCIEIGMAAFERLDPNFERSSEVNTSILNGIACYKEMLEGKRQFMKHSLSVSDSEQLLALHSSTTASCKKSSVLTAKKTARDLSESPSSKLVKCPVIKMYHISSCSE